MGVKIKYKDKGLNNIREQMKILKKSHSLVGFPANGDMAEDGQMTLAGLATIHEYGTADIPKRPFMRKTNKDQRVRKKIRKLKVVLQHKVNTGQMTAKQSLAIIGEVYAGEIKRKITNGHYTHLAESTVKAKGSSKPLIDEGTMRRGVTHKEIIRK